MLFRLTNCPFKLYYFSITHTQPREGIILCVLGMPGLEPGNLLRPRQADYHYPTFRKLSIIVGLRDLLLCPLTLHHSKRNFFALEKNICADAQSKFRQCISIMSLLTMIKFYLYEIFLLLRYYPIHLKMVVFVFVKLKYRENLLNFYSF